MSTKYTLGKHLTLNYIRDTITNTVLIWYFNTCMEWWYDNVLAEIDKSGENVSRNLIM